MKFSCMCLKLSGACCAIIGKQSAKLSYEILLSVLESAWLYNVVKAAARGPGVAAVGFSGGGLGDCSGSGCVVDVIFALVRLHRRLK
jgi:hypothetical protein